MKDFGIFYKQLKNFSKHKISSNLKATNEENGIKAML